VNSYLDVFIGEYSIETVLAELARCLSLFPNLHTVQIDVISSFRRRSQRRLGSAGEIFEQTFKKYSYPQIRNVFVMSSSVSFVASCPQARRVGLARYYYSSWSMSRSCVQNILELLCNCPHLEVLEDSDLVFRTSEDCERALLYLFLSRHCIEVLTISHSQVVVNNFPNLRTIQLCIYPAGVTVPSCVCPIIHREDSADSLVL
jgi:hypothetical protein